MDESRVVTPLEVEEAVGYFVGVVAEDVAFVDEVAGDGFYA